MCRLYGVSRSGFYARQGRGVSTRARANAQLLPVIRAIHAASGQSYGSPRVHRTLSAQHGIRCGKQRVARLMQRAGLRGRVVQIYRRQPGLHRFFDGIGNQRRQAPTGVNQVWVGDLTYLRAGRQRWYLAVVMDLYSRRIVGWAMGRQRTQRLTTRALRIAVHQRRPPHGVIFHTDRGIEYVGRHHRAQLLAFGLQPSTNRPRHSEDNSHMESFFHSLKAERIHGTRFASYPELHRVVREYIEHFYNRHRMHSSLDYRSPEQYELQTV
jgi:transposase InsO family protein